MPRRVVKLSDRQYANALRDLFGASMGDLGVRTPGSSPGLFLENLETHRIGDALAAQYQRVAEEVGRKVAARADFLPCPPTSTGSDPCVRTFLADFGARVLRRPLARDEVEDYSALFDGASGDAAARVGLVVEALLQTPSFLHRTELGGAMVDGRATLTPYELAAQLSFWLLDSIPDPPLWEAARSGRLGEAAGLRAEVDRLLASSRVRETLTGALLRWFELTELAEAQRDGRTYPAFADARGSLVQSAGRAIEEALWGGGDGMARLFTAPEVHVDGKIGKLLGIAPPGGAWTRMTLPDGQRAGLLTHPAVMARFATVTDTNVVERGVFVRRALLCQPLAPPPEGLAIEELGRGLDQRAFAAARAREATCAGCHALIDPIGLMFERFDAVGAYRDRAGGKAIETAGVVTATDFDGTIAGPLELSEKLAKSPAVAACALAHLATLGQGRTEEPSSCLVRRLVPVLEKSGGDLVPVLRELALAPELRVRTP